MTERLEYIFGEIPACETFADVACDHGYIAEAMLKSGRCRRAFVADISEKSLKKAQTLLAPFIVENRVESFVSDGFACVPDCDVALVAGIGGTLTVEILRAAERLPKNLVLQPMKHCEKVRRAAVELGYRIVKDFTFRAEGQFYDIIVLERGADSLTNEEAEFGRTNIELRPAAFREKIKEQIGKLLSYTERENVRNSTKERMLKETERLKKYV